MCVNSLTGCETTVDGVPKHLYRQEYVSAVSGGSPFASEKGICWRGTPSRAHDGGRQRGPCSTGLFHSPYASLGTLERGR